MYCCLLASEDAVVWLLSMALQLLRCASWPPPSLPQSPIAADMADRMDCKQGSGKQRSTLQHPNATPQCHKGLVPCATKLPYHTLLASAPQIMWCSWPLMHVMLCTTATRCPHATGDVDLPSLLVMLDATRDLLFGTY